jgi:hypothetical protein
MLGNALNRLMVLIVMMMVVVIVPVVPMMVIAVPRHRSPHDRAGTRAHDGTDGSADGRSGCTSDDRSADGVFASRCAGRGGEGNTDSGDENRNTHRTPPIDGCRSSTRSKRPTGCVGHMGLCDITLHPRPEFRLGRSLR